MMTLRSGIFVNDFLYWISSLYLLLRSKVSLFLLPGRPRIAPACTLHFGRPYTLIFTISLAGILEPPVFHSSLVGLGVSPLSQGW
jgi:hypothetical protein